MFRVIAFRPLYRHVEEWFSYFWHIYLSTTLGHNELKCSRTQKPWSTAQRARCGHHSMIDLLEGFGRIYWRGGSVISAGHRSLFDVQTCLCCQYSFSPPEPMPNSSRSSISEKNKHQARSKAPWWRPYNSLLSFWRIAFPVKMIIDTNCFQTGLLLSQSNYKLGYANSLWFFDPRKIIAQTAFTGSWNRRYTKIDIH